MARKVFRWVVPIAFAAVCVYLVFSLGDWVGSFGSTAVNPPAPTETIAEIVQHYEKRLKEKDEGLSFLRRLVESQHVAQVDSLRADSADVRDMFAGVVMDDGRRPLDLPSISVPPTLDVEYPILFRKEGDQITVLTIHPRSLNYYRYQYYGVGRNFDLVVTPRSSPGSLLSFTSSNDVFLWKGVSVGMSLVYNVYGPMPSAIVSSGITIVGMVDLDVAIVAPYGIRAELLYRL